MGIYRLAMKIGSDIIHATSAQAIMKRMRVRGVPAAVYVPILDNVIFPKSYTILRYSRRMAARWASCLALSWRSVMHAAYRGCAGGTGYLRKKLDGFPGVLLH